MILNALVEKLKRRSKDDFKGRHFEATLILQAVSWYLRYPLSYRDLEELFLERGLEVDHSTLNPWVLAYAPLIERRLRTFRKPRNYSPPHRCEKLSQIRHVPERRIQRRSMAVRPQVSNVPEETIQTSSRLATRVTSHRQLLSTWRWLDIGISC